jgi:adhesin transport system membrane fusion protein
MSFNVHDLDKMWNYRPVLWLMAGFVVFFFIWAASVDINQQVRGSGRVIPSGNARYIQHLEGGTIKEILAKEGQEVQKGAPLFYVSNEKIKSQLNELEATLKSLQVKQVRLEAETQGLEALDFSNLPDTVEQDLIDTEQQLFASRQSERQSKLAGLNDRLKQKVLKLDELETNVKNLRKERNITQEQLTIREKLRKSGAISHSQYLDTKSQLTSFNTKVEKIEKEIPITKTEMAEIVKHVSEVKEGFKAEAGEELNKVILDIKATQERINAATDQVERTSITSPINGIVSQLNINTIGAVVQSGERLAEIVPIDEALVVEGRVSTQDRGKIWEGLPATVQITAYDYTIYGGISGKLTYVSANSFTDRQDQEYYIVRITLDHQNLDGNKRIYPGMIADINIIAGEISVLRALLKPLLRIKGNALRES